MLASWKKSYDKPTQWIEKQRHHFASKGLYSQSFGFSSGHVWIWELDLENAQCWRTDAFELWCWRRLLRGPSTARRSNQSIPKEINLTIHWNYWCWSWSSIFWPPDVKNWLIGKHPDAGKDWRQEKKGMTEDEMVGWHHWLKGHELELTPGDSERQESLVCCSPWGYKESDTTERLNNKN